MSKRKRPPLPNRTPPPAAQTIWTSEFLQWIGALVIVALVCLVYYPSLAGDFLLDDDLLLTNNKLIQSPGGLPAIWFSTEPTDYWPVTNTSLWVEWRIWGASPHGYRVVNLVLHLVDVLLLWAVLAQLSVPGAYLAALLFAVHPVNVESVAWIAQRKNLLALLFSLLSVWLYLKSQLPFYKAATVGRAELPQRQPLSVDKTSLMEKSTVLQRDQRLRLYEGIFNGCDRWYWLSLLAFVLAMLSKGSVAILPLALVLILWWQGRLERRDWFRLAPFFVVAIMLTAVNIWFQSHDFDKIVRHATPVERLLAAAEMIWFYLSKAVAPVHLSFIYPQWKITAGDFGAWVALAAAVVVSIALVLRRNTRSGRAMLIAWIFFCVALLPVLGFTDVAYMQWSLVADHYQHIALIAVVALCAGALTAWFQQPRETARVGAAVATVVVVAGLAILTLRQSTLYGNAATLYSAAVAENTQLPMLRNMLGNALANEHRFDEAIESYRQALALKPDDVDVLNNLGLAYLNSNRAAEAIAQFHRAIKLDPNYAPSRNNVGISLIQQRQFDAAIQELRRAVELEPKRADYLSNLGTALYRNGKINDAIESLEAALKLDPNLADTHLALATALAKAGQTEKAYAHFKEAVRLSPDLQRSVNVADVLHQGAQPQK